MLVLAIAGLLTQLDASDVEQLRHRFIEASNPKVCGEVVRDLTRKATVTQLDVLSGDRHAGVAAFASLELLARASNAPPEMFLFEHGRFTGRMEQVYGHTAPTAMIVAARSLVRAQSSTDLAIWPTAAAVDPKGSQMTAKFKDDDRLYFAGERTAPEKALLSVPRRFLLGGCLFAGTNGEVEWRIGTSIGNVEIPKGDEFARSLICAVGHATETQCVVYLYEIMGNGGVLQLYDRANGRLVWTERVWGTNYSPMASSGPATHHIDVFVTRKHVTLVGLVPLRPHFYIERFDAETGRAESRFATNYWQRILR